MKNIPRIRLQGLILLSLLSPLAFAENGVQRVNEGTFLHAFLVCLVGAFIVTGFVYKQCIRGQKASLKKPTKKRKDRSNTPCCIM